MLQNASAVWRRRFQYFHICILLSPGTIEIPVLRHGSDLSSVTSVWCATRPSDPPSASPGVDYIPSSKKMEFKPGKTEEVRLLAYSENRFSVCQDIFTRILKKSERSKAAGFGMEIISLFYDKNHARLFLAFAFGWDWAADLIEDALSVFFTDLQFDNHGRHPEPIHRRIWIICGVPQFSSGRCPPGALWSQRCHHRHLPGQYVQTTDFKTATQNHFFCLRLMLELHCLNL